MLAAIIPETKTDRQADYLGLYFFSWEQRKALNELAAGEELNGQRPQCPVLLPSPEASRPHPSPQERLTLPLCSLLPPKAPRPGEVLAQSWGSTAAPSPSRGM